MRRANKYGVLYVLVGVCCAQFFFLSVVAAALLGSGCF